MSVVPPSPTRVYGRSPVKAPARSPTRSTRASDAAKAANKDKEKEKENEWIAALCIPSPKSTDTFELSQRSSKALSSRLLDFDALKAATPPRSTRSGAAASPRVPLTPVVGATNDANKKKDTPSASQRSTRGKKGTPEKKPTDFPDIRLSGESAGSQRASQRGSQRQSKETDKPSDVSKALKYPSADSNGEAKSESKPSDSSSAASTSATPAKPKASHKKKSPAPASTAPAPVKPSSDEEEKSKSDSPDAEPSRRRSRHASPPPSQGPLQGVVIYLDVAGDDSDILRATAESLGASVVPRFSKAVTHIVFLGGKASSLQKASVVKVVTPDWLNRCSSEGKRVSEDSFLASAPSEAPADESKASSSSKTSDAPKSAPRGKKVAETKSPAETPSKKSDSAEKAEGSDKENDATSATPRSRSRTAKSPAPKTPSTKSPAASRSSKSEAVAAEPSPSAASTPSTRGSKRKSVGSAADEPVTPASAAKPTASKDKESADGAAESKKKQKATPKSSTPSSAKRKSRSPSPSPAPSASSTASNATGSTKAASAADADSVTPSKARSTPSKTGAASAPKKDQDGTPSANKRRKSQKGESADDADEKVAASAGTPSAKRNQRSGVTISYSKIQDTTLDIITSAAGQLKAQVVTDTAPCTHLVVESPARTLKLFFALARGSWIVDPSWVFLSLEKDKWQPEEPFEVKAFPGAPLSRKCKAENGKPLLQGLHVFVHKNVKPDKETIEQLVVAAGGTVAPSYRRSKLCIAGADTSIAELRIGAGADDDNAPVVKVEWLFDSLAQYTLLSQRSYSIGSLPTQTKGGDSPSY